MPLNDFENTVQSELSRRRFLQTAALTGVATVVPVAAEAQAASRATAATASQLPNPIGPNFAGEYGGASLPSFQVPKRAMGSTGLQVSIIGMGGYHLGTVGTQDEA